MFRKKSEVPERFAAHATDAETTAGMEITPFEAEMLIALLQAAKGPGYLDWAEQRGTRDGKRQ